MKYITLMIAQPVRSLYSALGTPSHASVGTPTQRKRNERRLEKMIRAERIHHRLQLSA